MHRRLKINLLNVAICSFLVQEKERSAEVNANLPKNRRFKYMYQGKISELLIHND